MASKLWSTAIVEALHEIRLHLHVGIRGDRDFWVVAASGLSERADSQRGSVVQPLTEGVNRKGSDSSAASSRTSRVPSFVVGGNGG